LPKEKKLLNVNFEKSIPITDNTTKDPLKKITESMEQGIKELFQSDKYMDYLRTMSRFHKYSLNNTLLISMQKPDATYVASFNKNSMTAPNSRQRRQRQLLMSWM
jgi:hypothetical protein